MGDSEEKVAMLSLGWYVLFSFRKQARERKGRRAREERRIQIPTEYASFSFFFFFLSSWILPEGRCDGGNAELLICCEFTWKASLRKELQKSCLPANKYSWRGTWITECWCQEQRRLPRRPSPQNNCQSANRANYPNLYRCPVKCQQSCHLASFAHGKRCSFI